MKTKRIDKRALAHILCISMMLNPLLMSPAMAGGKKGFIDGVSDWLKSFRRGGAVVEESVETTGERALRESAERAGREGTEEALEQGARVADDVAERIPVQFEDQFYRNTNGMFSDFSARVDNFHFPEIVGRKDNMIQYMTELINPNTKVIALTGRRGMGKTQLNAGFAGRVADLADDQVPDMLRGAQIVELNPLAEGIGSLRDFKDQVGKVLAQADPQSMVIVSIPDMRALSLESAGKGLSLDHYINAVQEANRATPGRQAAVKIVIETTEDQLTTAAKASRYLQNIPSIKLGELTQDEVFEVLQRYARQVVRNTGNFEQSAKMIQLNISDDAIRKCQEYATLYYSDLGEPAGAMKLLQSAASGKVARMHAATSPLGTELRSSRAALQTELKQAKALKGKHARSRVKEIETGDSRQGIKSELDQMDNNIKDAEKSFAEQKRLVDERQAIIDGGDLSPARQTELDRLDRQIGELNGEDLALYIHLDREIPLKELMKLLKDKKALTYAEKVALYERSLFGQKQAVESVVAAVEDLDNVMRAPGKPAGSFIMAGPPGVGKTQIAKVTSIIEERELIMINGSELIEAHSVAKLIGSPPGYVGEDIITLVDRIRANPRAVVLVDELEKAHPDVQKVLLQVLDEGRLVGKGLEGNFEDALVFMTTNIVRKIEDALIETGEMTAEQLAKEGLPALERADLERLIKKMGQLRGMEILDEFLNRVGDIITFQTLGIDDLMAVGYKALEALNQKYVRYIFKLDVPADTMKSIAKWIKKTTQGAGRDIVREAEKLFDKNISLLMKEGSYRVPDGAGMWRLKEATRKAEMGDLVRLVNRSESDDQLDLVIEIVD